jgi:hypothetical protein
MTPLSMLHQPTRPVDSMSDWILSLFEPLNDKITRTDFTILARSWAGKFDHDVSHNDSFKGTEGVQFRSSFFSSFINICCLKQPALLK